MLLNVGQNDRSKWKNKTKQNTKNTTNNDQENCKQMSLRTFICQLKRYFTVTSIRCFLSQIFNCNLKDSKQEFEALHHMLKIQSHCCTES